MQETNKEHRKQQECKEINSKELAAAQLGALGNEYGTQENKQRTWGHKYGVQFTYWGGPLLGVQKANVFTAPKMRLLQ